MTDEPLQSLEKAMFWIEYVIRHKGAKYLRSPAADATWFSFFMIDVVTFLLITSLVSSIITYKLFSRIFSVISNTLHSKTKTKSKENEKKKRR